MGKSRGNEYISRCIQPTKIEQKGYKFLNRFITTNDIKSVIISQQRKVYVPMDLLPNSTRHSQK
jgi:hypothetical protein